MFLTIPLVWIDVVSGPRTGCLQLCNIVSMPSGSSSINSIAPAVWQAAIISSSEALGLPILGCLNTFR